MSKAIEQYTNAGSTTTSDYFLLSRNNVYYKLSQPDLYSELQALFGSGIVLGSIDAHTDVDTTTTPPSLNDVLTWDGTNWVPDTGGGGGAVSSVFTRTGAVVAASGDYDTSQVTEFTNLYFTDARARTAVISSGTSNYLPKYNGTNYVNSQVRDDATGVGIGKAPSAYKLDVAGPINMDEAGILRIAGNKYLHYTHSTLTSVTSLSTFLGYLSGAANNAVGSTGVGKGAMTANTTGTENTAIGYNAYVFGTTGIQNTVVGAQALNGNNNSGNTVVGAYAAQSTTSGYNVILGHYAGYTLGSGGFNVAIGGQSIDGGTVTGSDNVAIGYRSGRFWNGSATRNISIGSYSGFKTSSTYTDTLVAGYESQASGSNMVVLGGNGSTSYYDKFFLGTIETVGSNSINKMSIYVKPGGVSYSSGTNNAGHDLVLGSGRATGDGSNLGYATYGDVVIQTTNLTTSGTTLNALADRAWFKAGTGNFVVGSVTSNAAAGIELVSTTKGIRFPNMTTTQKNAIATPPAGLVVFDTDTVKLECYDGSTWNALF